MNAQQDIDAVNQKLANKQPVSFQAIRNLIIDLKVQLSLNAAQQARIDALEIRNAELEAQAEHKPIANMIVSASFAERWTDNPDHYREHFPNVGNVEIKGGK